MTWWFPLDSDNVIRVLFYHWSSRNKCPRYLGVETHPLEVLWEEKIAGLMKVASSLALGPSALPVLGHNQHHHLLEEEVQRRQH